MRYMKDEVCDQCGMGKILIVPFKEGNDVVVSHLECDTCGRCIVVSQENYMQFVVEYAERGK